MLGRTLRQYRIEEKLGRGGMGVVYRAHDTRLDRTVALKVLPPYLSADEAATQRFLVEARAAAALDHPNVCTIYEIGEHEQGRLYIAMAYYEGETLTRILERGPLPIKEALDYARQIGAGLSAAHAQAIIHRDIKPGNVIVTPEGVAKVLDFGIAKLSDVTLTATGTTLGTVPYMSPEQVRGDTVDQRTDLWSLGVVLYEMLTGERPFKGAHNVAVVHAILHESPKPVRSIRAGVPPELESAVARLLSKERADRYSNVDDFSRVLELAPRAPARGLLSRVGTAVPVVLGLYVAMAWVVLQVTDRLAGYYLLPAWVSRGALLLLLIGLPIMLAATVVQTLGPGGLPPIVRNIRRFLTWRRALRGGVAAFALLGIASGMHLLSRTLGVGPAATLISQGALEERALVVLSDFESAAPDLARLATEAFRIDLSQSQVIRLAQPRFVRAALGRMEREPSAVIDVATAHEVAQREGAAAVVGGEIHEAGGQYLLAVQLFTPGAREALASVRETARDSTEIIGAIDNLSSQLRERIGESARTLRADPPLPERTTSSLEALRKYSQAMEAEGVGDYERSVRLLEEAVALDTTFAMAYRFLGIRLSNMGRQRSRVRHAYTKAFEYRDRLTEYERYSAMATYYMEVTREPMKAVRAYEDRLALNADDVGALNNIGYIRSVLRDYERAEDYYIRALDTGQAGPFVFSNLAMTQASQGKFEEARQTIAAADELWPGHPNTSVYAGWMEAAAGNYTDARAHFEALRQRQGGEPSGLATAAADGLAAVSAVTGKLTEAEAFQREAMDMNEALGLAGKALRNATRLAYLDILLRGDAVAGLTDLEAALERRPFSSLSPLDRPYLDVAAVYASAGRPDRAREVLEQFEREVEAPDRQTWTAGEGEFLRAQGHLAEAEGRYVDAIELFRRSDEGACLLCALPVLAESFDRAGQPDSAIAVYERYLSTPFGFRTAAEPEPTPAGDRFFLGPTLERLGQLYDERGDLESASSYYARFVELWAEADEELQPRVRAAQQRVEEILAERG